MKSAVDPMLEFDRPVGSRYPDSVLLFTDGAHKPASERARAGFCVPSINYRFGIRLFIFARFCLLSSTQSSVQGSSRVDFSVPRISLSEISILFSALLCLVA